MLLVVCILFIHDVIMEVAEVGQGMRLGGEKTLIRSKKTVTDPQQAEYDKLWCWKCRGHTDYRVVRRVHRGEHQG